MEERRPGDNRRDGCDSRPRLSASAVPAARQQCKKCHDLTVVSVAGSEVSTAATPGASASIVRRLAATAAVRVAGLACTVGAALTFARLLGAAEFGRNALALSWATGLGTVALAGTDQLLLRELSAHPGATRSATLRAFARRLTGVPTAVAVVLATVATSVALGVTLLPGVCALVILVGAMRRRQALLLAQGRTGLAQAGEWVAVPLLQVALAAPLLWAGLARHSASVTVSAYAVAVALVVAAQSRAVAGPAIGAGLHEPTAGQRHSWTRTSRGFAVVSIVVIAQASIDLWILDALGTQAQVGAYAVAARLATLVALPLTATTYALSREAAALHSARATEALQHQVTAAARLAAGAAVAIAAAVVLVSPLVRPLLGESFHGVTTPLVILVGGQLANVVIGPVATLLLMSGHERDVRNTLLLATILNAALTAALAPDFGAVGAATGGAVSLVAWNVALHRIVRKRLRITTAPLPLSRLTTRP